MKMYCVFDRKMREFASVIAVMPNDESVIRAVADSAGNGSLMTMHPGDFDLFCLGEIDRDLGTIEQLGVRLVANVADVLPRKEGE